MCLVFGAEQYVRLPGKATTFNSFTVSLWFSGICNSGNSIESLYSQSSKPGSSPDDFRYSQTHIYLDCRKQATAKLGFLLVDSAKTRAAFSYTVYDKVDYKQNQVCTRKCETQRLVRG